MAGKGTLSRKSAHHKAGKVFLLDHIKKNDKNRNPCRVCLDNAFQLILAPGSPFRRIHIEKIVQDKIFGYNKIEVAKIDTCVQRSCTRFRVRKNGAELYIPCKQVGNRHYQGVHQQVQSVKILLIVLNHILLPSCKYSTILLQKVQLKISRPSKFTVIFWQYSARAAPGARGNFLN